MVVGEVRLCTADNFYTNDKICILGEIHVSTTENHHNMSPIILSYSLTLMQL